jgi:hypothetical protein
MVVQILLQRKLVVGKQIKPQKTNGGTVVSNLDTLTVQVADLGQQMEAAASESNLELMVELAGKLTDANTSLMKEQKEANAGKIAAAESAMIAGFKIVVENANYKDIAGEEIHTVVYYWDEGQTPPVFSVQINPKTRKAGTGGTRRPSRANVVQHRLGEDGELEHKTVKEVVVEYASDKIKGESLYPKNAWGALYPKVNGDLSTKFEDCDCFKNDASENGAAEPEAEEAPVEAA